MQLPWGDEPDERRRIETGLQTVLGGLRRFFWRRTGVEARARADEGRHALLDLLGRVRSRELHADASLALRHDAIDEAELARTGITPGNLSLSRHSRWYVLRHFLLRAAVLLAVLAVALLVAVLTVDVLGMINLWRHAGTYEPLAAQAAPTNSQQDEVVELSPFEVVSAPASPSQNPFVERVIGSIRHALAIVRMDELRPLRSLHDAIA